MAPRTADNQPLRVALVGCGQIADMHIAEIQKIKGVELVAVCDQSEIMAEQAAVRFGVRKFYTDLSRLLQDERPDVVHVTTPPHTHLALGKTILATGAHLYMEKPFTVNAAEAEQLIACAEQAGRQICPGHNYSYDAAPFTTRQMVEEGRLGEILHIESVYGYDLQGSFGRLLLDKPKHWIHSLPGRLVQNVAVNALYKITDYLPDAAPTVQALGYKLRPQRFGDRRDAFNDELRVTFRGARCTASLVFSSHVRPVMHYLRLYGSKGSVHVDWPARTVQWERTSTLPGAIGRVALPWQRTTDQLRAAFHNIKQFAKSDLQYNDGMNRLFRLFYQSIRENRPSPIPMTETLRVTRLLDEIIRQTESPA